MKPLSVFTSILLLAASSLVLLGIFAVATFMTLPDVRELERCFTTSMYGVKLCPASENYVRLNEISPYVLHAVISSEDGAFYSHKGFDWHEIEESLNQNLRTGHIQRGGSTLTQQLAKNAFLGKEKSFWRKLKEAYLAHGIENHFSKNFILEKYLNVVEFGPSLYGVKPAANKYFHKSPSQLGPLEAAYLAFLLPNPKVYSKSVRDGKLTPFARKSIGIILRRMAAYGKISSEAYQIAVAHIGDFPWSNVSFGGGGTPSFDLEISQPTSGIGNEPIEEENALDEVLKEDEENQD